MSLLSKLKSLNRKRDRLKKRNKNVAVLAVEEASTFSPDIKKISGLKITMTPLKKMQHLPILVGNFTYNSASDFAENNDMIEYWGKAMAVTRDIHNNYIVYWKERFPLFDEFDYNLDDRHFRVMLICTSLAEAEEKLTFLKSGKLIISHFGHHKETFHTRFEKQYKHLLPFVYYEDSVRVIAVEAEH